MRPERDEKEIRDKRMRVVGCFLQHNDKFLVLLRRSHKPDGNTWGLPSGKVEANESDVAALLREVAEETGYQAEASELEHLGDFKFISSRDQPYVYATYKIKLKDLHEVKLEEAAHAAYKWITAEECYARSDLISGLHKLLKLVGYIQ